MPIAVPGIDTYASMGAAAALSAKSQRVENASNLSTNYLKNFLSACGRIRGGVAGGTQFRSTIACIGDSKYMGAGADGSAGNTAGAEPLSKWSLFSTMLTAQGLPATHNTMFGFRGLASPAALVAYDTRITFGAGLALSGVLASLGGFYYRLSGLTSIDFLVSGSIDTAEVFTRQSASDGIMLVTVDGGGTLATIDANGADAVIKTVVPLGSLASHTVNLKRSSGNFVYPIGLRVYDSTKSGFDIINAGAYGSSSSFHADTSTAWTAANTLASLTNLSLVLIQLTTNDPGNGISLSTSLSNIQTLITKGQAAGADVVLECPTNGPDATWGTISQREALRQGIIGLGAAYGCVVTDNATRFISYADAFARGRMGPSVHETVVGYADEASFMLKTLLQ